MDAARVALLIALFAACDPPANHPPPMSPWVPPPGPIPPAIVAPVPVPTVPPAVPPPPAPPPAIASPPDPSLRTASQYFAASPGMRWVYDVPGAPMEFRVLAVEGGVAKVLADGTSLMTWQLKDGAWLETFSARGPTPVVILPAELRVGTRWAWTYTDGLGTTGTHRFRILDLDASVTLPSGKTMDHCLKVEEIRPDLGPHAPNTHWFAPGIGRVATRLDAGIWWRALRSFTP